MKEIKKILLESGFKGSYPYSNSTMVRYTTSQHSVFDIYLDQTKPNRISALRLNIKDKGYALGLIGNFINHKGKMRRFSFSSPEDLIKKLEKIEGTLI